MNAAALVFCLLEDTEFTPDGYSEVDAVAAGDYVLKLWKGQNHVQGRPVEFFELSLNARGRSFDPKLQHLRYPGSIKALGQREVLVQSVARWLRRFGEIYVGSANPDKLAFYRRILTHYLSMFIISRPYPAFDECEGVPEYFRITLPQTTVEALLRKGDVERYYEAAPSAMDRVLRAACARFDALCADGTVQADNRGEWAESVAADVLREFELTAQDEDQGGALFNTVLAHILAPQEDDTTVS